VDCFAAAVRSGKNRSLVNDLESRADSMVVTSIPKEVDWTLDPLVNGNSGGKQFGLRDQWKKEGAKDDSPLMLIITLLSSINQIYRNPTFTNCVRVTPASTVASQSSTLTRRVLFISCRSIVIPPRIARTWPSTEVPIPKGTTGSRYTALIFTI
jgi:hypothetical protein